MAQAKRKDRERERRRNDVLEAAEAVFAQKGFYKATMRDIARRAEFAVGSIYNMFDSKTDVYRELIQLRVQEYFERVKDDLGSCTETCERVRAVIRAKLKFFDERQRFFQIFTHIAPEGRGSPAPGLTQKSRESYRAYLESVAHVFKQGVEEGVFIDVSPVVLALAVEGMTNAVIAHSIHTGGERITDVTPEQIERIIMEGIVRKERKA